MHYSSWLQPILLGSQEGRRTWIVLKNSVSRSSFHHPPTSTHNCCADIMPRAYWFSSPPFHSQLLFKKRHTWYFTPECENLWGSKEKDNLKYWYWSWKSENLMTLFKNILLWVSWFLDLLPSTKLEEDNSESI